MVVVVAGVVGTSLNCDEADCRPGFPSWLEPWTWGDYSVYPEAFYAGLVGIVPAAAFPYLALAGRRGAAVIALVLSLALVSYAFFGGLTTNGRLPVGVILLLLAAGTLVASHARRLG
jgi:hypothetical protein